MNKHSLDLIIYNLNTEYEKEKIYVFLTYTIKDGKKYIYLLFKSLRWYKNYYIPLGVYESNKFNKNVLINHLNYLVLKDEDSCFTKHNLKYSVLSGFTYSPQALNL